MTRRSKLSDHPDLGGYIRNRNWLYRAHLWGQSKVAQSKRELFDEKTFPRQKLKDTHECVLDVNNVTISSGKRYPANFQTTLARSPLEDGGIQLSRGNKQEESKEVGSSLKNNASELIENNIAEKEYEPETRVAVSTEPKYTRRESKAPVRVTVNALKQVRYSDELTVYEALNRPKVNE